jgi:hypothetical protein
LNNADIPAAVLHKRPEFGCTRFEHEARIIAAPDIAAGARDAFEVPEPYGAEMLELPLGVRPVIFNHGRQPRADWAAAP